ncbi:hypothetical protein GVN24_27710 [Rhizobium sp. CRIBSB]|nr:hypothetical protein [Rhizobium sp. CRIBSB]
MTGPAPVFGCNPDPVHQPAIEIGPLRAEAVAIRSRQRDEFQANAVRP